MSLVLLPPEAAARVARAKLWLGGWAFWLTGVDAAWLEDEARLPLDFVPTNAFKTFLDPKLASVELIASALERS